MSTPHTNEQSSFPADNPAPGAPSEAITEHRPNGNPYLAGNFAPVPQERTVTSLKITGAIPAGLNGHYLRSGPNPRSITRADRHSWFVGDGMLHIVELRDGAAVTYRNRWVRTAPVTDALGEPATPGPQPVGFDGSNTNIVSFGGKILSVTEGALPYQMNRDGETLARLDFGGGLSHGLSAHCKYDPATGELHNVSWRLGNAPFAIWQVIDRNGQIVRTVPIEIPATGMWHTFSLTDRYVVLYDHPVLFSVPRVMDGWAFPFAWEPQHQSRIGLIERAGDGSVTWIDVPPAAVNHDVGAHDTPSGVTVYATYSDRLYDKDAAGPLEASPRLMRFDIEVANRSVKLSTVDERAQEFPRANPSLGLAGPRFLYAVGDGPGASGGGVLEPGNGILKHDLVTGTTERAAMGRSRATAEATFVPDPARAGDEDGGWLLSYVYDAETDLTDLVIADAQDMSGGPVATVSLQARVPFGFHGDWFPAV